MATIIAYVLVVCLANLCLSVGLLIVGFPVALVFAWSSIPLRTKVAGFCGAVAGVALAVAFGYGVFRVVVGPNSYSVGAFLASTLPLLIAIRNDILQLRRVTAARQQLLETIAESRGEQAANLMAEETATASASSVVGEISGLVAAVVWFFSR